MTVFAHTMGVDTFVPMLRTLSQLLEKGAQYASAKKLAPRVLVDARLAPDMFSLAQQVQMACYYAVDSTARLAGQTPPVDPDEDQSIDELKARIDRTIEYLQSVSAAAFEGAESMKVEMPLDDSLVLEMKGLQFLKNWGLPQFYFHVVTAYDILRTAASRSANGIT